MSKPSDFIPNDLDVRRLLEDIIDRQWSGWPCPNCKIPTWTGINGCPICGLSLYEAQILNGYRSPSPYEPSPKDIRDKRALPRK